MIKKVFFPLLMIGLLSSTFACKSELSNPEPPQPGGPDTTAISAVVKPVDINELGFDLLSNMQGHWVGANRVIGTDYDWFSFDYRAISPSHVHGIFEGGSMGNLFTSFFVTDFKDTRTIMARNGGVLNGIYRTSYFVLDSVSYSSAGDFYRLVDAEGGKRTMWMELRFTQDSLYWNAYTSRLGMSFPPTRHMSFRASKADEALATSAAAENNFPQNIPAWDFSEGFNQAYLQAAEGAKSATFLAQQDSNEDVLGLALASGDPFRIDHYPSVASLQVNVERNTSIMDKRLFLFLSKEPLTDEFGYYRSEEAFNSILLFPELVGSQDDFRFTYLHPGEYYLTVIADANDDGVISAGDLSHPQQQVTVLPEGQHEITITNITIEN